MSMQRARIGLVGAGWRAQFFAKVIQALPERFELVGIVCRSEESAARMRAFGAPVLAEHEALWDLSPDFTVLCANRDSMGDLMRRYAARGVPTLVETFPARSAEELAALYSDLGGAKIQAAEQYPFQPMNAARIALADSGLLGRVYQAQTSIPNGYHAVAVLRRLLHAGRACPVIRANRYTHRMIGGPGRGGDPAIEAAVDVSQVLFQLDWGDRQALNDVEDNQHRSFVRTQHAVIRGERGELRGDDALYLSDHVTPCHITLERVMAGGGPNLEGLYLRGVRGGERGWYYQNQFMPARLFDDEIAVATCLARMADYAAGGSAFYPLAEEMMDQYLTLMIGRAMDEGRALEVPRQPWTE